MSERRPARTEVPNSKAVPRTDGGMDGIDMDMEPGIATGRLHASRTAGTAGAARTPIGKVGRTGKPGVGKGRLAVNPPAPARTPVAPICGAPGNGKATDGTAPTDGMRVVRTGTASVLGVDKPVIFVAGKGTLGVEMLGAGLTGTRTNRYGYSR